MAESIGSVYVGVLPDARDFVTDLRGQIMPQMGRLGDDAGAAFVRGFSSQVEKDLPTVFPRLRPSTNRESGKSGKEAGDAFGRALDSRITAAIRALPDITVGADTSDVEFKLFTIKQQLSEMSGKVGVDLSDKEALAGLAILRAQLDELAGPEHDVRVRINAGAARAELAELEAQIAALDEKAATPTAAKKDTGGLLLPALIGLGPALIPLAAELGAVAAGGAAALGTLLLGFKGVSSEIKNNTALGKQWQAQLTPLKSDLTTLETTASRALIGGFSAGAADAQKRIPALAGDVQRLGSITGGIAQHGVSALFGAFQSLDPLIEKIGTDIEGGAAKLDKWANGGGLNKFASWAEQNLPAVEHDVEQIAKLVGNLLAAGAGQGMAVLNGLGSLSKLANTLLPEIKPLVPLITDVYLAMALYGKLGPAIAGLKAFGAAQLAAGAATAESGAAGAAGLAGRGRGLAGSAALGVGKASPYIAAALVAKFGIDQAADSTSKWQTNNNALLRGLNDTAHVVKDLTNLNPIKGVASAWNDVFGGSGTRRRGDAVLAEVKNYQGVLAQLAQQGQTVAANRAATAAPLSPKFAGPVVSTPQLAAFNTQRAKEYAAEVNQLGKEYAALNHQLQSTPVSQAGEAYNKLQSNIQANVDSTDQLIKLGGKTVETYDGLKVGANTYAAAEEQTGLKGAALVGFIHGQIDAMGHNRDVINDLIVRQQRLGTFQTDMTSKYKLTTSQVDLYSAALGLTSDKITASSAAEKAAEVELGAWIKQLSNGSTAIQGYLTDLNQFLSGQDDAAARGKLIGSVLKAANGDALDFANTMVQGAVANQQFVSDFLGLKKGVLDLKTGMLDFHNAGAAPVLSDLASLQTAAVNSAAAVYQHENALGKASAADDAFSTYVNDTQGALVNQARQLGLTAPEAKKLADQYFGIKNSGDLKKQIELIGQDKVTQVLGAILQDLDSFTGHTHSTTLYANADPALAAIATVNTALNHLPQSTNSTINANSFKSQAGAHGMMLQFARGGLEDHSPAIYKAQPGTVRVFAEPETSWEAYIPGANDGRRPRAKAIAKETVRRLGGVAMFETGGFTGVDYSTSSSKAAASKSSSLAKLRITIEDTDIPKFLHALGGTAAQIQSAETTLVNAVTKAGGGTALGRELTAENTALERLAASRATIANKLKDANTKLAEIQQKYATEKSTVAGTITGSFDITSAGYSPGQILAGADRDKAQLALFTQQLAKVQGLGLNKADLQKFREKGLSSEPALLALSRASRAQIAGINADETGIAAFGNQIGAQAADYMYGAGVNAAKGLVAGLKSQDAALTKAMTHLADTMVGQIRRDLKIHSPSQLMRELGAFVGEGMALGIADSHSRVRTAASGLGAAAVPAGGSRTGGSGINTGGGPAFVISGINDPVAAATAVERRMAMLGA